MEEGSSPSKFEYNYTGYSSILSKILLVLASLITSCITFSIIISNKCLSNCCINYLGLKLLIKSTSKLECFLILKNRVSLSGFKELEG